MHTDSTRPAMRTVPVPTCPACGGTGPVTVRDAVDDEFGSPGRWSFRSCTSCATRWLDPRPHPDDLHLAYADYYTHGDLLTRRSLSRGVPSKRELSKRVLARLPHHADDQAGALAWLGDVTPGRALDVGCGDGRTMVALGARGWSVEGCELDPVSVEVCRRQGLDVRDGTVERLVDDGVALADAVVASHVVEHVEDPRGFLRMTRALIRPGGRLIVITPNPEGRLAHSDGARWRGLEPPRHLQIFSPVKLSQLVSEAGFRVERSFTTARGTNGMARAARRARRTHPGGAFTTGSDLIAGEIAQVRSWSGLRRGRCQGDEQVVIAVADA